MATLYQIQCHSKDCKIKGPHEPEIHDAVLGLKEAIETAKQYAKDTMNNVYINWNLPNKIWYLITPYGKVDRYNEETRKLAGL